LRSKTFAAAALAAATPIPAILPADPQPAAPTVAPAATPLPTVVRTVVRKPQPVMVLRTPFHPPAFPSPWYVLNVIAPYEAARWQIPLGRLQFRIRCESGGSYMATNGQYAGVGQFAWTTFTRGVASIGVRRVTMTRSRVRERRIRVIEVMSDGSKRRRYEHAVRQRIVHRLVGKLPRRPAHRHAWAQVRIMARAMAGLGGVHDSEWDPRCR
jgi:hypothetical protein